MRPDLIVGVRQSPAGSFDFRRSPRSTPHSPLATRHSSLSRSHDLHSFCRQLVALVYPERSERAAFLFPCSAGIASRNCSARRHSAQQQGESEPEGIRTQPTSVRHEA
jgi:hypothetical protein